MVIPDSICYPRDAMSTYPYNPDGSRDFLEDKPFLEPFSLIPALGAVTSRLRFTTFVVKVPIRNPVLLAKQATSTAVLTGNRLVLGVGTSPWREDYDVLGVDWAHRGRRLDESIAVLRGLAAGGYFEHHGEIYEVQAIKIAPVPTEPIPVLIGGHADAALRRAARLGDGWMHGGGDPAELPRLLARLAELRRQAQEGDEEDAGAHSAPQAPSRARPGEGAMGEGLPHAWGGHRGGHPPGGEREFEIHVISLDAYTVDGVRRLEEQGVTDVIIGFRWPYVTGPDTEPLSRKLDNLRRFADDVIAKTRSAGGT
jgi:alkanesulfonate monooxygenase SsuD/methylene tetrahydromethanopterin reductase-like flavin-dependent oxidoreductase (luciferase family)